LLYTGDTEKDKDLNAYKFDDGSQNTYQRTNLSTDNDPKIYTKYLKKKKNSMTKNDGIEM